MVLGPVDMTEDAATVLVLDKPAAVLRIACGMEDAATGTIVDELPTVLRTACVEIGPPKITP
jgi:hypothetical protein